MENIHFPTSFSSDLQTFGVVATEERVNLWSNYLRLLIRWNARFNLTAIRNPDDMVVRHICDSLSIAPYVEGNTVIDVGAGAGIPGIPLAIAFPEKVFVLLDSNGKKTRFMQQAVMDLGLSNCTVVQGRVESYVTETVFDHVVCRAFASLNEIGQLCHHLIESSGSILAMKGKRIVDEMDQLSGEFVTELIALVVPGLEEERYLAVMKTVKGIKGDIS